MCQYVVGLLSIIIVLYGLPKFKQIYFKVYVIGFYLMMVLECIARSL